MVERGEARQSIETGLRSRPWEWSPHADEIDQHGQEQAWSGTAGHG